MCKEGSVPEHTDKEGNHHAGAAEKEGVNPSEPAGALPQGEKEYQYKNAKQGNHVMMSVVFLNIKLLGCQAFFGTEIISWSIRYIHQKSPSKVK